jgi:hypothetical protein
MRPGRGGKIAAAIRAGNFWAQLHHDRAAVRAFPGGRSRAGLQSIRESRRSGRAEKTRSGHNSGRSQKLRIRRCLTNSWCERGDSNPHGFPRQILSLVRLPIPPLSHLGFSIIYRLLLSDDSWGDRFPCITQYCLGSKSVLDCLSLGMDVADRGSDIGVPGNLLQREGAGLLV